MPDDVTTALNFLFPFQSNACPPRFRAKSQFTSKLVSSFIRYRVFLNRDVVFSSIDHYANNLRDAAGILVAESLEQMCACGRWDVPGADRCECSKKPVPLQRLMFSREHEVGRERRARLLLAIHPPQKKTNITNGKRAYISRTSCVH